MKVRPLLAKFSHETNTFSPIQTPLAAFGPNGPSHEEEARERLRGSDSPFGAFLELAESWNPDVNTPVVAEADPSAAVERGAYEQITGELLHGVGRGCDAILLDLHGAMVAEGVEDGEGELLARIRARVPAVPICVGLDLHANITQRMVDNADIIVGYKTYPHIDMHATGEHAGSILARALRRECGPVTRWCQVPLLAHTLAMDTSRGAMQWAIAAAKDAERELGILAVSIFGGFPLADFPDAGMSVVVTADRDPSLAQRTANRIAEGIWGRRDEFIFESEPLAKSMQRAARMAQADGRGPVLLLDHSDNVYSGGTCDTLDVLEGALAAGLSDIAVGPICDPQAVASLREAGKGSTATVALGNKVPWRTDGVPRQSIPVTGRVLEITDGRVVIPSTRFAAFVQEMGRSVLLDIGAAQIIVSERRVEPCGPEVFTSMGIDPAAKKFLLVKSRMHCRPQFLPLARALIECDSDCGGPTSSKLALFPIRHMRRPLYPLDQGIDWTPGTVAKRRT